MSVVSTITVTVPATTANLGPGFDCIGAALKLYNEFKFTRLEEGELIIHVTGIEAERVQTDESNLLYQTFVKFYQHIEQMPRNYSRGAIPFSRYPRRKKLLIFYSALKTRFMQQTQAEISCYAFNLYIYLITDD